MAKKPAHKKPTKPAGKTLEQRLAASPALVKKYQSNPGLRSKYLKGSLEKYLTPQQKQKRALNVRLSAPIAPGSSVTERDLAHEAEAATTVRYGPQDRAIGQQLGVAQQTERDTGSFYDQYRQALQDHAARIQGFQQGAQQALAQTAQGITGLGSQEALQMQQMANQQAGQQGVAPAGDLSALANAALSQRQALMGSFQNQQALTGAAVNQFADTQANVVAPGQKLSALAQARGRTRDIQQKQADLATEKGAYNQQFRQERRGEEFKNQLAMQTLGLNKIKTAADIQQNSPEAQGAKAAADVDVANAKKAGLPLKTWQNMSPKQQSRYMRQKDAKGSDMNKRITDTSDPFFGLTPRQVQQLPQSERDRRIRHAYNLTHAGPKDKSTTTTDAKAFKDKYGVQKQPTSKHNAGKDAVGYVQSVLKQVGKKNAAGKPVTTDMIVQGLTEGAGGAKKTSPLWIRVGLELARGGLTPGTANRLHKAGYSVAELGFKMRPAGPGRARTEHLP